MILMSTMHQRQLYLLDSFKTNSNPPEQVTKLLFYIL